MVAGELWLLFNQDRLDCPARFAYAWVCDGPAARGDVYARLRIPALKLRAQALCSGAAADNR